MSELFLHIFNTAITAGWLVLAVVLARLLLKKAPAWVHCALWAIVALRLVWPFEIESLLSLVPSTQTVPPAQLYSPVPQVNTGIPVVNNVINPVFGETFAPVPSDSVNPLQVVTEVAGWVWIAGMVAMAIYTALSYYQLKKQVRVRMPVEKGVYLSDGVESPFILGFFAPKIYLPSDIPQEKWESILSHEKAHLARKDHWWKPLGFLLLTIFWFHPLLWLGYILLCRDVERACDEKVIKHLSAEEKKIYSEVLLSCSLPRKWISACPLAFGETGVKGRIKAVLHYKKPTLWILIAALIVGSVLAVCFLTEPEENKDTLPGNANLLDEKYAYYVSELVAMPANISFCPNLEGCFRITKDNILQYDSLGTSDSLAGWRNIGRVEAILLKEENFDAFVHLGESQEDGDLVKQLRENNSRAWHVVDIEDCLGWDGYFLEQQNGDIYYIYGVNYLFKLEQREVPADQRINITEKSFIYEKEGAGSSFTITIYGDGTFSYYAGWFSSHIGMGVWEQKGGKLYLYESDYSHANRFVFYIEENALVYFAAESSDFMYVNVADGERFYAAESDQEAQQDLIWVTLEEETEHGFIGVDTQGDRWEIHCLTDTTVTIPAGCWVRYYTAPMKLHDGPVQYRCAASQCWIVREDILKVSGPVYDYCLYDMDGDGELEECILSAYFSASDLFSCKLSVWNGLVCEYEVQFHEITVSDNPSGINPSTPGLMTGVIGFAFDYDGDQLRIVTNGNAEFFTTGQLTTYELVFADGHITITEA